MTVRLYGRSLGFGSHAAVTRGFMSGLMAARIFEGFVPLDLPDEEEAPLGAMARDGIFTGALDLIRAMGINARHERRWAVVAPNSTYIPPSIVRALREGGITALAPSSWAAERIAAYDIPSRVVHHGLAHAFHYRIQPRMTAEKAFKDGRFVVTHLSTSDGDRKGTLELIRAWNMLREAESLPEQSTLACVLDVHAERALRMRLADAELVPHSSVKFLSRLDGNPEYMAGFYSLSHVVCQPSRGEAFGFVGLEARACGVPVVATKCTGHSAGHLDGQGVVTVDHAAELFPIDDGPGALAPRVSPVAIAEALAEAYCRWPQINEQARDDSASVCTEWSWQAQLQEFMQFLQA